MVKKRYFFTINNITALLLLFLVTNCTRQKTPLKEGTYYAISPNGLMQLKIKVDTLNFTECADTVTCQNEIKYQYKIVDEEKKGNVFLLYVETLRYLTAFWKAADKYQIISLAYAADGDGVAVVREATFYKSLQECKKGGAYLRGSKFSISYYSPAYLKKISAYPSISTIDSAEYWRLKKSLAREAIRNKESIRNTNTGDIYMTATTRELLNRAMLQQKINPLIKEATLDSTLQKLKQQYQP